MASAIVTDREQGNCRIWTVVDGNAQQGPTSVEGEEEDPLKRVDTKIRTGFRKFEKDRRALF